MIGLARWGVRLAAALGAVVAIYLVVTFVQVWLASRSDHAQEADAIVVLGAAQYDGKPSPVLRARLDHVAELYERGMAPLVVVTGGRAQGDRFTEAGVSAAYLHGKGVPEAAIIRETTGKTSWQSLASAARILRERGATEVILVSDPFHASRIGAIADELGLEGHTSPTRTSPIDGGDSLRRMVGETGQVALGRIIGFRRLVRVKEEVRQHAILKPAHSGVV